MNETMAALDASPLGTIQAGLRQSALELALQQALTEQDKAYAQWQLTVSKPRPKALSIAKPSERKNQKRTFLDILTSCIF